MTLRIGRMQESDIDQILKIQSDNQRDHLTPSQRENGYLSIAFSADEFRAFDKDLCVVVARENQEIIGYCCISSARFNAQFPILDQIVADMASYPVPDTKETPQMETTCIYGPVCISAPHRGGGVLKKLSSFGLEVAGKMGYSCCLSFISAENVRSIKAHRKLSFQEAGKVRHNGNEYRVIARIL
jgi:L-amino acid N-acyltransferase YncA